LNGEILHELLWVESGVESEQVVVDGLVLALQILDAILKVSDSFARLRVTIALVVEHQSWDQFSWRQVTALADKSLHHFSRDSLHHGRRELVKMLFFAVLLHNFEC
jgi:hypothetical protein